jgi:hypothetical protein
MAWGARNLHSECSALDTPRADEFNPLEMGLHRWQAPAAPEAQLTLQANFPILSFRCGDVSPHPPAFLLLASE